MSKSEKVMYWLDLADYDIETAKAMFQTKRFLYVGFMCHQTIEKALKAAITQTGNETPPKIHNLIKLYEKAGLNEKLSEKQSYFIAQLNPMNIEARYTEHKEKLLQILTAETCENYLKETESLLCWIKKQL